MDLPAGPNLPSILQGLLFGRDPVGVLLRCRARYGPIFTLRFPTTGPVVAIAEPELALRLIHADPNSAHAGEARRTVLPQASPRSSFGGDGDQHATARGRIEPPMSEERLAGIEGRIARIIEGEIASWPHERPFRVLACARKLTREVFIRTALGVAEPQRAEAISTALGRLLRVPGNPPVLPPAPNQAGGQAVDAVFTRRLTELRAPLAREIDAARVRDGDGSILAHALTHDPDISTEALIDELVVVLAASQEPPAIAMTWTLERLSRLPEVGRRFSEAAPDDPLRQAIIDETLRLRPPALASLRRLTDEVDYGGHRLPRDTDVMVPIPLLHRDPQTFPEPDRFKPDRFLRVPPPPPFVPFGAGARRCPGEALARLVLRIAVPLVLERLRLRFLGPVERPVQRATVLVPQRSGLALARPRVSG